MATETSMMTRKACLIATVLVSHLAAQQKSAPLKPPYGESNSLPSPNGIYRLFGDDESAQLWLANNRTRTRRLVLRATIQTLTLAWSPDSTAFVVNDRLASDQEEAYLYNVLTLDRLKLRRLILAADPRATRFVPSEYSGSHAYVHALKWLGTSAIQVQLEGHTDGSFQGTRFHPVQCFDLRYRISRQGAVRKLSERVVDVSPTGCGVV